MTDRKLHPSCTFFKEISHESKRIKIAIHYIQTFIDQAKVRGSRMGDGELLILLEHAESFFAVMRESSARLEKLCEQL
jgi:hypothetical protein